MRRLVAVAAMLFVVGAMFPAGAGSQSAVPNGSTTTTAPAGPEVGSNIGDSEFQVWASHPGTLEETDSPGVPRSGPRLLCGYFEFHIGGAAHIDIVPVAPIVDEPYLWYCWEPGKDPISEPFSPTYPVVVVYQIGVNPPGEAITSADAAQYAMDRIVFEEPTVVLSPAARQIVGVPTWLSVTSELDYPPVSVAASWVWATARAEFKDVTWNLGNGDEVVCTADATLQWDPNGGSGQSSDCTYVYEAGADEPFVGSATVTWTILQQTNDTPAGTWVFLDEISIPVSVDIAVTELEAAIR